MSTVRNFVVGCVLAHAALPGQDQATTLLAGLRAADAVVVAQVVAASDPSPEWHRLEFATITVLKGPMPATFALLEPAGACCGRSLFTLQPEATCVLFLRRQGPAWHPWGGSRGVLPANGGLVAHLQSLQQAGSGPVLATRLVQALASDDPRIADDAAHALAALPHLTLGATDRAALTGALQQALTLRTTRAAALADAAARVADAPLLDALLPLYLDAARDDQARLLRSALRRSAPATLGERLPMFVTGDQRGVRAAELLLELPTESARTSLGVLLRNAPHPRVQLCVVQGLLANGDRGRALAAAVPEAVRELAQHRADRPRAFRAIDPSRR